MRSDRSKTDEVGPPVVFSKGTDAQEPTEVLGRLGELVPGDSSTQHATQCA